MLRQIVFWGCLLILLAQAACQIALARTDSQTTDEAVHVLAGYTYLTKRDFRFNPEHPPLVKILAALPLLAIKPNLPVDFDQKWQSSEDFFYDSWRENRYLGEKFFYASGNDANAMVFWSRLPMIVITFLLGLAILLITWRHFGHIGALVATGFYALDPLVAGHGHLVTTDIAFGLGTLLTAYATWHFFGRPSWRNAVWLGLALALALLTKHTAVILVAALVVIAVWTTATKKQPLLPILKGTGIVLAVALMMIWVGHGFNSRSAPPANSISSQIQEDNASNPAKNFEGTSLVDQEQFQLTDQELSEAGSQISTFDRLYPSVQPLLRVLPGDYLKGLLLVIGHASGGHDSFLLGETSSTGWWYYFPILIALKLPLVTLAALLALIYVVIQKRPKDDFIATAMVFAGIFMISAMSAKANIGLRHIFPVLPLAFVGFGWLVTTGKYAKEIMTGFVLILAATFVLAYPSYLGYFNELAGASGNNYQIATDSNLDWGQDLKRIRDYVDENGLDKPVVEYGWLGTDALTYYLEDNYRLLSETEPAAGNTLIIGATAINRPDFADILARCDGFEPITNGAFVCQIIR